jgi:glycosyltransferase involved in cell wall biosynthesis
LNCQVIKKAKYIILVLKAKIKNQAMQNFSVIIPVYNLESPIFLSEAINSVLNQSRSPNEIIVVIDGPIGKELNNVIKIFTDDNKAIAIRLENSAGPGAARHAGILKSTNNIVALMDSDDISRSDRFEKELDALIKENVDVVGGWIEEFNSNPGDLNLLRSTPEIHEKIALFGKWRMPVNHVTLVFKKKAYFISGGYKNMRYAEDFDLVSRMLGLGIKFYNVQKVMVDVRVGNLMHNRRRGVSFLSAELQVFKGMYSSGYISIWQYIYNIIIRVLIRLLPSKIMAYLYRILFRKNINNSSS